MGHKTKAKGRSLREELEEMEGHTYIKGGREERIEGVIRVYYIHVEIVQGQNKKAVNLLQVALHPLFLFFSMCYAFSFRFSSAFCIPRHSVIEIANVPIICWHPDMDDKSGPANIPDTLHVSALSIFTMIYMTDAIITHICTLEKDR